MATSTLRIFWPDDARPTRRRRAAPTTATVLRLYRPDDAADPVRPAATPAPADDPPWLAKGMASIGMFLSPFRVGDDVDRGALGNAVRTFARKAGREGERRQASSNTYGGYALWPVDLLAEYFDGRLVGGVLIDAARFRAAAASSPPAA